MTKKRINPMDRMNSIANLAEDADTRKQEQEQIEAEAKGEKRPRPKRQPKRGENVTTLTVMMSQDDKAFIRRYSEEHMIGMSDMVHAWLVQLQEEEAKTTAHTKPDVEAT